MSQVVTGEVLRDGDHTPAVATVPVATAHATSSSSATAVVGSVVVAADNDDDDHRNYNQLAPAPPLPASLPAPIPTSIATTTSSRHQHQHHPLSPSSSSSIVSSPSSSSLTSFVAVEVDPMSAPITVPRGHTCIRRGHPLKLFSAPDWLCRLCLRHPQFHDSGFCCESCNFDVCAVCSAKLAALPPVPSYLRCVSCRRSGGGGGGAMRRQFSSSSSSPATASLASSPSVSASSFENTAMLSPTAFLPLRPFFSLQHQWSCGVCNTKARADIEGKYAGYFCGSCSWTVCYQCANQNEAELKHVLEETRRVLAAKMAKQQKNQQHSGSPVKSSKARGGGAAEVDAVNGGVMVGHAGISGDGAQETTHESNSAAVAAVRAQRVPHRKDDECNDCLYGRYADPVCVCGGCC